MWRGWKNIFPSIEFYIWVFFPFNAQHKHTYNSSFVLVEIIFSFCSHFSSPHHNQHKSPHIKWQMINMPKYFLFSPNIFISAILPAIRHLITLSILYSPILTFHWRCAGYQIILHFLIFFAPKIDKFNYFQIIEWKRVNLSNQEKKSWEFTHEKEKKKN